MVPRFALTALLAISACTAPATTPREAPERLAAAIHGRALEPGSAGATAPRQRLLLFTASWCGWCRRLKTESLASGDVRAALAGFALEEIDVDVRPEVAARYHVRGIPALVVLERDGSVARRTDGYVSAERLAVWLR